DDCQRVRSEVVALDFEFLEGLTEIVDLGFFRLVNENVFTAFRLIRTRGVTCKRTLRVVKMPPARVNMAPALGWVLFFPFGAEKTVGFDFQKPREDQWKALC